MRAFFVSVACVATLFVLAGTLYLPDQTPRAGTPPPGARDQEFARELVSAMLVHDRSIRSLEWDQVAILNLGAVGEARFESTQATDEVGRWRCSLVQRAASAPPDNKPVYVRTTKIFDGKREASLDEETHSGMVLDYIGDRRLDMSVTCWLGRDVDQTGQERLGEFLLNAPDLRLESWSERGLPVVAGTADVLPLVATLEIEIDPEHGFAPRKICVRDAMVRVPYWTYEVTEFIKTEGIWLPKQGTLDSLVLDASPDQGEKLTAAMKAHGVSRESNSHDPLVQATYRVILQEVFGDSNPPTKPFAPRDELTFTYRSVNATLPATTFAIDLPHDFRVIDTYNGLYKSAGSLEWTLPKGKRAND